MIPTVKLNNSIDTAAAYQNEAGVGQALVASGIDREDLFITTKLWNADQGYENTLKAFDRSVSLLGLEYLDLYLIHWPTPAISASTPKPGAHWPRAARCSPSRSSRHWPSSTNAPPRRSCSAGTSNSGTSSSPSP